MDTKAKCLEDFLATALDDLVAGSGEATPHSATDKLLETALAAAQNVPAYKEVLGGCQVDPTSLQLSQIPLLTKENYFRRFSIPDRCWKGDLSLVDFVHCSSGSSGQPHLWPRSVEDELNVSATFEQIFRDVFSAHKKTTLAVGYKLNVVTPGNKPDEILNLVTHLAPLYDQVVIAGYPPFVKGFVDKGLSQGVPWEEFNIKILLAGEVFSEEWRTLMGKRCGIENIFRDVVSMYGTADAGVIATETHLSASIRNWLSQRPDLAVELFGKERLPTLCQYSPGIRLLERDPDTGTLVVSSLGKYRGAAPLLRYGIGDAGGMMSFQEMLDSVTRNGFEIPKEVEHRSQPFVWVFGRSHWTVSIYGANVYVENIMVGMEQPELQPTTTGKFVLQVEEDKDLNKKLAVQVEMVPGMSSNSDLSSQVASCVTRELLRLNSEYANYVPKEHQMPNVYLHEFGSPEYFPIGVKHKYI